MSQDSWARFKAYTGATSKGRKDERTEAERTFFRDDRSPVHGASVVIWTERAGRHRCSTFHAFVCLQAGADSHSEATAEPIPPAPRTPWVWNPYAADKSFWLAVADRARREMPVRLEEDSDAD